MKISAIFLLCLSAITNTHAQLMLKQEISSRQAEAFVKSVPAAEFDKYVDKYGATEVDKNGRIDKTGLTAVSSQTEYKWAFKNTEFYSHAKAFRTNLAPPPLCEKDLPFKVYLGGMQCEKAIRSFVQCHLFLINPSKRLIAVQPLYIPQPDFIEAKPSCFDIYAMAPAQVVKDGMLIVAGYYDSRWICNSGWYCASDSPAASPDPLYKTTFLVRFGEDVNGKVVLSQDDKCLPPLNSYDTIATARRALKENGCH